ncbi:permease [Cladochytrium replicatum]|nr:permease [Cladochytrium replicatum]
MAFLARYFKLHERETTIWTELRAGAATFVTMAYIIAVNSSILSDTGGPCVCPAGQFPCLPGKDAAYDSCVFDTKKSLITATTVASLIATFLVGVSANVPFGVAPGMGINAFFAYTIVGFRGTGKLTYQEALGAVVIEGIVFFILAVFGLRQWLARMIPDSLSLAMGVGIGLFLCFIGLQSSEGIGLIVNDSATLVTLGGCPEIFKDTATGSCLGHGMESPTLWVGVLGFVIITLLLMLRVRGAVIIGILFVSIISWFRGGSAISYFPDSTIGNSRFDYFKNVVGVPDMSKTAGIPRFNLGSGTFWQALIIMLYIDVFDTTGTMYSLASFAGFTDDKGQFPGADWAFLMDSISITLGGLMGTSPVTPFIESASGVAEGGKTGLTAVFVSLFFFLSLFFAPIFASFPPWATGPALVVIGSMMMASNVRKINWDYLGDSIPAFVCIALMPLSYSIADGLIGGIGTYIVINSLAWIATKISGGKIAPEYEKREPTPWDTRNDIPILPLWLRAMAGGKKKSPEPSHVEAKDEEDVAVVAEVGTSKV